MDNRLDEAKSFYEDRILGWMIADLRKSIDTTTNYLTALGCLTYTEVIGIFLPELKDESGRIEERRFYRCLFRLPSADSLISFDHFIKDNTAKQQGIYQHMRNGMAHTYYPAVKLRQANGNYLFAPGVVARDAFVKHISQRRFGAPPITSDDQGRMIIATRNYTNELEAGVYEFIHKTFVEGDADFQKAAIRGINIMHRHRWI